MITAYPYARIESITAAAAAVAVADELSTLEAVIVSDVIKEDKGIDVGLKPYPANERME